MPATSLDQLVSLCKRRGFIFPGSEIYGGLANTWDYGPLGVALKNKLKRHWWDTFVRKREDMVGCDAAILMNKKVWEASGHVTSFADPLVDCKKCKQRFRGDKLLEEKIGVEAAAILKLDQVQKMLIAEKVACPHCGLTDWTEAKRFNLMFKTHQGAIEEEGSLVYLRPETAQGIFVNFKNVLNTMRPRLPFGIAQIGKAFRNEITPGNFTFRTREFEQMEIEYFIEGKMWEKAFTLWQDLIWQWYIHLGIAKERLRVREHSQDELCHYSRKTIDIEYRFPWGFGELFGLAYRTDFDLRQHQKFSGEELLYTDPDDPAKKFVPHVIEPSFGCDRTILTLLLEAYTEEDAPTATGNSEKRTVLKLDPRLAPIDVAILPLSKKEHLIAKAKELYKKIVQDTNLTVDFDMTGSIGKRYRRQDEIGTPRCITVDFGTLGEDAEQGEKDTVTIRDRDTLKQERVPLSKVDVTLAQAFPPP
ncbi:glycine--tRNA ligase [Candidatus Peregrinibacteria bacterium]|nr:glycine--tRNA ligase [Candidatus Peregrinibacteria bacterium]